MKVKCIFDREITTVSNGPPVAYYPPSSTVPAGVGVQSIGRYVISSPSNAQGDFCYVRNNTNQDHKGRVIGMGTMIITVQYKQREIIACGIYKIRTISPSNAQTVDKIDFHTSSFEVDGRKCDGRVKMRPLNGGASYEAIIHVD